MPQIESSIAATQLNALLPGALWLPDDMALFLVHYQTGESLHDAYVWLPRDASNLEELATWRLNLGPAAIAVDVARA